jgi:hypothetical protein
MIHNAPVYEPHLKGGLSMSKAFPRFSLSAGAAVLAQVVGLNAAHAVPSDRLAWSSLEYKIKVFKDAVDNDIYWFIPKIKFESNNGKTVLRPKTLKSGMVEYSTRIIPYFSKDLREMVAQNISNIRQDSQLQPVVAKTIGVSLPDFNYKFASPSVTDYQYLDVPRLVRFQLTKEEAASFDQYYNSELGVPVEFSVVYEGMMTDKFYNIDISCKTMARELSTNFKPSVGVGANVQGVSAYVGADLEYAFINSVQNSVNGVNVVSSGDVPGMQQMLQRVMNLCFEPVDPYGGTYYPDTTYPSYPSYPSDPTDPANPTTTDDGSMPTRTTPGRGDTIDDGFPTRTNNFANVGLSKAATSKMELAAKEAAEVQALVESLSLDRKLVQVGNATVDVGDQEGPGLLPSAQLKMRYALKKTAMDKDNQAVVKNVSMKNSTSTVVVVDVLTANAKALEKVLVQPIAEQKFSVDVKSPAASPLPTGIKINDGEQYTINAEFTFAVNAPYSTWPSNRGSTQYQWDSTWPKPDGDLYYRLGSGDWTPVNRRTIITSDVTRGGGELQFYVDRSAIFNKIPENLRTGGFLRAPKFTVDNIAPIFTVQVSGRKIQAK